MLAFILSSAPVNICRSSRKCLILMFPSLARLLSLKFPTHIFFHMLSDEPCKRDARFKMKIPYCGRSSLKIHVVSVIGCWLEINILILTETTANYQRHFLCTQLSCQCTLADPVVPKRGRRGEWKCDFYCLKVGRVKPFGPFMRSVTSMGFSSWISG